MYGVRIVRLLRERERGGVCEREREGGREGGRERGRESLNAGQNPISISSDFGNRPRKLYVVVNPASGEGCAVKTWDKVERLFQLTHITTELMCKSLVYTLFSLN